MNVQCDASPASSSGSAKPAFRAPYPKVPAQAPCFPPTSWAAGLLPGFSCIFICSEGIALPFRWVLPPFVL